MLYLRYRVFLLLSARKVLDRGSERPIEEDEDILQSAFLRAWKRISTFDYQGENSFRRWLGTVVVNTALDKSRRVQNRALNVQELLESVPAETRSVSTEIIRALETLTPVMRDVVVLKRFEKKTWPQVAEMLAISQSTARRTYVQALDLLREEIDPQDPETPSS